MLVMNSRGRESAGDEESKNVPCNIIVNMPFMIGKDDRQCCEGSK